MDSFFIQYKVFNRVCASKYLAGSRILSRRFAGVVLAGKEMAQEGRKMDGEGREGAGEIPGAKGKDVKG